jgi:hypothetical protein
MFERGVRLLLLTYLPRCLARVANIRTEDVAF